MSTPIVFIPGSDEPVHVPVSDVDSSWRAEAVLRAYPGGPELHRWDSLSGTAVVENGEVVLLSTGSADWKWTSGDVWITLTGLSGAIVRGPFRARLGGPRRAMVFEAGAPYVGPPRKPRQPLAQARADAVVSEPARLARLAARRRANAQTNLPGRTEESSP